MLFYYFGVISFLSYYNKAILKNKIEFKEVVTLTKMKLCQLKTIFMQKLKSYSLMVSLDETNQEDDSFIWRI